jgi:hypothetical protein
MAQTNTTPNGWECTRDETRFDSRMDREYTKIAYQDSTASREVFVSNVQEPNKFGGWGYLVWVRGKGGGELGLVEDLDSARELAIDYMEQT